MPEAHYEWLERDSLLSFEELSGLVDSFIELGVKKVRLTGGEPLLRRNLSYFISMLAKKPLNDLAMTTNGVFLAKHVQSLKDAGLGRLTISLDTLRPERFLALTGQDVFEDVVRGIDSALDAGFERPKINCVLMQGFNDDEIIDFVEFAKDRALELRFIEYMDVGGATKWHAGQVFGMHDVLQRLSETYGTYEKVGGDGSAPSRTYRLPHGQHVGIIASVSMPFCGRCDRARITADGVFLTCLYADQGFSLRTLIRQGVRKESLQAVLQHVWSGRDDAGAQERLALRERQPIFSLNELRSNVHREMHIRGG
jgi:cyclic pyranopterin phosphate synthase